MYELRVVVGAAVGCGNVGRGGGGGGGERMAQHTSESTLHSCSTESKSPNQTIRIKSMFNSMNEFEFFRRTAVASIIHTNFLLVMNDCITNYTSLDSIGNYLLPIRDQNESFNAYS